ncbi:hypothetical protein ALC56_10014 [Trachymyrmex septentrionalis]|uniref:Uncharacterized protein n=1 Tax=Trachymyrmex septentrionalis TaxID=34720 RepID=A0A195F5K0_9HYME|nr:hypothetical protein ALC56_10014 [Trachymyrmex septentrionalis]
MNLRRSDDDNDYLFAETPNADDSFVKACGITTQRTSTLPCDKKEKTWRDGDSENARAKGYEMKFSSHPFCVSEGIPVRQEVPSRNPRKRKKNRPKEEKEGKDEIGEGDEEEG